MLLPSGSPLQLDDSDLDASASAREPHNMEAPHLLALKVMRLSRPSLAQIQPPWVSPSADPDTFQHHVLATRSSDPNRLDGLSTGKNPQSDLQDAALSPLLTLPAAFGTICLGETFAATLNLSNETTATVSDARITVEMQSQSAKQLIEEKQAAGPAHSLEGQHAMELSVEWEVKELGMHVLVCTVHYGTALEARSFQKFYKFNVSPPLSIKTRVHLPASANGRISSTQKENVYLEVHVQNTSPVSVTFERLVLDPVAGLQCQAIESDLQGKSDNQFLFRGPFQALMPRDTRQYLFVLSPTSSSSSPSPIPIPGAILPLGRLDITWRSTPFAEKGRLLTSILNRRVPGMPPASLPGAKPPSSTSRLSRAISDDGRSSPRPPPVPPKSSAISSSSCEICVTSFSKGIVSTEDYFNLPLKIKVRRKKLPQQGHSLLVGLQHVPFQPAASLSRINPTISITTDDESAAPVLSGRISPPSSARPFSPSTGPPSRPLTPVTSQLRQASTSAMSSAFNANSLAPSLVVPIQFPPSADLKTETGGATGELRLTGTSLVRVSLTDFVDAPESDAEDVWEEAVAEINLKFVAWSAGLAQLGGVRVMESVDDAWSSGKTIAEEDTLGSVWIHA